MRLNVSAIALTVLTALCVSACCTTHKASTSKRFERSEVATRDTVREQVTVEVHDTIREKTTITVLLRQALDSSQADDTVKVTQITNREHTRNVAQLKDKSEKIIMNSDSTAIQHDSVVVTESQQSLSVHQSPLTVTLKWLFGILLAFSILMIVLKLTKH